MSRVSLHPAVLALLLPHCSSRPAPPPVPSDRVVVASASASAALSPAVALVASLAGEPWTSVLSQPSEAHWHAVVDAVRPFLGQPDEATVVAALEPKLAGWPDARRPLTVEWLTWTDEGQVKGARGAARLAREADLSVLGLSDESVRVLVNAPPLAGLTALSLGGNPLGNTGLFLLAKGQAMTRLTRLDLRSTETAADGVRALLPSPALRSLTDLDVGGNEISGAIEDLAESDLLARLTRLSLRLTNLRNEEVTLLVRSPRLAHLRVLDLGRATENGDYLRDLAASPHLTGLTWLGLEGEITRAGDLRALAQSSHLTALTTLLLANSKEFTGSSRQVLQALRLPQLTTLDLSRSQFADARGVSALTHQASLPSLASLSLVGNCPFQDEKYCLGHAGVRALARSPRSVTLTSLDLSGDDLDDDDARELARSPHFTHLTSLVLAHNGIGPEGVEALAQAPWMAHVQRLDLTGNPLDARAVRTLAGSGQLGEVRAVLLEGARLDATSVAALSGARWPHLTTLSLRSTGLDAAGVQALVNGGLLDGVTHLDLSDNPVGDAFAAVWSGTTRIGHLTALRLARTGLTEVGARDLARAVGAAGLTSLDLSKNASFGDRALTALASAPWHHLTLLATENTDVTSTMRAVGRSRALAAALQRGRVVQGVRLSIFDVPYARP